MLIVKYIIPEDGDDIKHPNVFFIEDATDGSITLQEIKKAFPVNGVYFFRFLKNIENLQVWMDVVEEYQSGVPMSTTGIFIKANRISSLQTNQPKKMNDVQFNNSGVQESSVISPANIIDKPTKANLVKNQSEKLIKFDDFETPSISVEESFPSLMEDNDLLGITSNSSAAATNLGSSTMGNSDSDLFGLQHIQPEKQPVSAMNAAPVNLNRSRGVSPMVGGSGMGGGNLSTHSPSSSMNNFMSQQQQSHQQQALRNTGSNVRGGMNAPPAGGGMNPMMGGGSAGGGGGGGGGMYDPFNNIAGLNTQQQQQPARGQQQTSYNNVSGNNQNNRPGQINRNGGRGF